MSGGVPDLTEAQRSELAERRFSPECWTGLGDGGQWRQGWIVMQDWPAWARVALTTFFDELATANGYDMRTLPRSLLIGSEATMLDIYTAWTAEPPPAAAAGGMGPEGSDDR